jgi:hypothetical protein
VFDPEQRRKLVEIAANITPSGALHVPSSDRTWVLLALIPSFFSASEHISAHPCS